MRLIIDLLQMDEWYGVSENIEIAKGKYKLESTIKEKKKQQLRLKAWQ
jgi:hypothetical protein